MIFNQLLLVGESSNWVNMIGNVLRACGKKDRTQKLVLAVECTHEQQRGVLPPMPCGPDASLMPQCRSGSAWWVSCSVEPGLHAHPFPIVLGVDKCLLSQVRNPAVPDDAVTADHNPAIAARCRRLQSAPPSLLPKHGSHPPSHGEVLTTTFMSGPSSSSWRWSSGPRNRWGGANACGRMHRSCGSEILQCGINGRKRAILILLVHRVTHARTLVGEVRHPRTRRSRSPVSANDSKKSSSRTL